MDKIKSLTPEQQQQLIADREKYLRLGLTTDRAPRAEVEQAVAAVRSFLGKPCDKVWWFDGPATASIAAHLLRNNLRENLRDNLWENLGDNLWENLGINLGNNLGNNLRDNLRDNPDGVRMQPAFWGGLELYWIAYYLWPHDTLRPIHTEEQATQLRHWVTLAKAGCWIPFTGVNILCEPPSQIRRQDGRLHNDTGPAVEFRDGWVHWSINGVAVDEQVVMRPESQTIEQIRGDDNEERRRIRIERYGWTRYLEDIHAKIKDTRRNDVDGTDEILLDGDNMVVLVCACPSTARVYGMEVPNDIKSCEQAQRWLRNTERGFCLGAS